MGKKKSREQLKCIIHIKMHGMPFNVESLARTDTVEFEEKLALFPSSIHPLSVSDYPSVIVYRKLYTSTQRLHYLDNGVNSNSEDRIIVEEKKTSIENTMTIQNSTSSNFIARAVDFYSWSLSISGEVVVGKSSSWIYPNSRYRLHIIIHW